MKKGLSKKGIVPRMDKYLFNHAFISDFDEEKECFHNFYWTHLIKCPGRIRDSGKIREVDKHDINIYVCADKFLQKEIAVFQPKLIVALGKYASSWILGKIGYKGTWTDYLLEEIQGACIGEKTLMKWRVNDQEAEIFIAPHPSGRNPLATVMYNLLKNLISTELLR